MPHVRRSALVPYAASEMFTLVADVESYPQFLPWCTHASVRPHTQTEVEASLEMSKGPLHKRFTTRNTLQAPNLITMRLVDGPFRALEGSWRFDSIGSSSSNSDTGCEVALNLEFEFSSKLLAHLVGPVFGEISSTMVDAFCERAHALYGTVRRP